MPTIFFRRNILERFLTQKQMERLDKMYSRSVKRWLPTRQEIKAFRKRKYTLAHWMSLWGCSRNKAIERLGKLYLSKLRRGRRRRKKKVEDNKK